MKKKEKPRGKTRTKTSVKTPVKRSEKIVDKKRIYDDGESVLIKKIMQDLVNDMETIKKFINYHNVIFGKEDEESMKITDFAKFLKKMIDEFNLNVTTNYENLNIKELELLYTGFIKKINDFIVRQENYIIVKEEEKNGYLYLIDKFIEKLKNIIEELEKRELTQTEESYCNIF